MGQTLQHRHTYIVQSGPEPKQPQGAETQAEACSKKGKEKNSAPVNVKKENATLAQRIEILNWHHASERKNQTQTAKHWVEIYPELKLKQHRVSRWLQQEAKWRAEWAEVQAKGRSGHTKRVKQVEHPEVDEMLELWVAKAMSDGIHLNGEIIRQKWKYFADLVGIPEDDRLNLSEGWLTGFKKRCGLKEFKRHGEAGSVSAADVEKERARIRELIQKYGYRLRDIFNMDETGLFWA